MSQAESRAAAEHKNVLLTFDASWCGNCRLFDRFVADPAIRPIIDKAFVLADLDTGERPGDEHHANIPGGLKLRDAYSGQEVGYPYIVMLDPRGALITDSRLPSGGPAGGNIGYPDAPNEIDWFMQMLEKAAPSLSAQDTATIRTWLTAHSSRH